MKNLYYKTDDYVSKLLIDVKGNVLHKKNVKVSILTSNQSKELLDIFNNINEKDWNHRCITVYRDAVIINDIVYNLCLSCGDIMIGDKHFILDNNEITSIENILNN